MSDIVRTLGLTEAARFISAYETRHQAYAGYKFTAANAFRELVGDAVL